jgi:hypothetical protein
MFQKTRRKYRIATLNVNAHSMGRSGGELNNLIGRLFLHHLDQSRSKLHDSNWNIGFIEM